MNCVVVATVYLGGQRPGQPVVQEIRDRDERARGVNQPRRRAAGGVELIDRVDRQELDAGDRVNPLAADALEDRLHRAVGAAVAIVIRVLEQVAALADQRVVDAPAVDADRCRGGSAVQLERTPHLLPEVQDVPLQRARSGGPARSRKRWTSRTPRTPPVERAEHRPAAFGAEIEGEEVRGHGLTAS